MPTKDFDWGNLLGDVFSNLGPLYGLGRGIANPGGMNMGQVINYGREAANLSDPFAPQRAQYQQQLQQLMTDPNSIQNTPGYQFRLGQGVNAIDRSAAARGMLNSGNRMYDLENYAQGLASTEYDNQLNRLMTLSGATTGSPAAAGQSLMDGLRTGWNMENARYNDIGSALGMMGNNRMTGQQGLLSGLGNLLGQGVNGMGSLLGRLFGGATGNISFPDMPDLNMPTDWDPYGFYSNELTDLQDMGTMFNPSDFDWGAYSNASELADYADWSSLFG